MSDARAAAIKWANEYEIKEGEKYGWVEDYAKDQISKSENLVERVDGKAQFLMRLIGALTLGVSVALLKIFENTPESILPFCPGLVLLAIATWRASTIIRPTPIPYLPRVERACEYVRDHGEGSRTKFYLKAAAIEVSFMELLAGKSQRLRSSFGYFLGGVAWICLSVFYIVAVAEFQTIPGNEARWVFMSAGVALAIVLVISDVRSPGRRLPGPIEKTTSVAG